MELNFQHPCGLQVTDTHEAAVLFDPQVVSFETVDGDNGDITVDGQDFGWNSRFEAEAVARYFGLPLAITEGAAPAEPSHPRRA